MFWRNNYLNDETLNEYLNSNDRTAYTYIESKSYQPKFSKTIVQNPKLFRHTIHQKNSEFNETNVNTNYVMKSTTPRQRKSFISNSNRVLRSKANNHSYGNDNREQFVHESDIYENLFIGSLNTNTNNSGPEEIERNWSTSKVAADYHLSADEEDRDEGDERTQLNFNNANINSSQNRLSNQWFQKNMFGLPNDESDEMQAEFSGAISGDEQYDIAPLQNSKTFQKNKLTKTNVKKSSRSSSTNIIRRIDSMICSPVAVISYVFEFMWLVVTTITSVTTRSWNHLANYSNCPRWYLMPVFLPGAVIYTSVYWFAYSIDRIFGMTRARRLISLSNSHKRWTIGRWLLNTLWFLLWVVIALITVHLVMNSYGSEESSQTSNQFFSAPLFKFVDKNCMEVDDCCHTKWQFTKRFVYCLVSLPIKSITNNNNNKEPNESLPIKSITNNNNNKEPNDTTESPIVIESNSSDFNSILYTILSRLKSQEELIKQYHIRMSKLEEDSTKKVLSESAYEGKLMNLNKLRKEVMDKLEGHIQQSNTLKTDFESSVENVVHSQKEDIKLVTADVQKLKEKIEGDMELVQTLIDNSNNTVISNTQATINLTNLFIQLQETMDKLSVRLEELNGRTTLLEMSNEKLIHNSIIIKKEIREEISKDFELYKLEQTNSFKRMNLEMSRLEETLEKDYSKLLDKNYLSKLIESHLGNVESNIINEVNGTMWNNIKQNAQKLLESLSFSSNRLEAEKISTSSSNLVSKSCQCPSFFLRRQTSCVRVSKIRKMIADALDLYSADKIGLADFALESAGGTIATTRCTETYTDRAATLTIFGVPLLRLTNSPRTIIQPSVNPGECWAMKGSSGNVMVQLSGRVQVTAVTIDHIPKSLSPSGSIDSAIKDFEIKAFADINDSLGVSIGNFTYNIESSSVQTFNMTYSIMTNLVEMIVHSNYGNEEYTCIYRLRVHGNLVK